ncbi:unnamed protein product, partial [Polarella glacialis]
ASPSATQLLRQFTTGLLRRSCVPDYSRRTMTVGIEVIRADKGEAAKVSEKRRFRDGKIVDVVLDLDQQWVKAKFDLDQKRKEVNSVQSLITDRKKSSKGSDACEDLVAQKTKIEEEAESLTKACDELLDTRDKKLGSIGNFVHDTVPISQDEEKDNEVVATWGVPRSFEGKKFQENGFRPHFELLEMMGAVEFEPGNE